jgi:hypothetical protein
MGKEEVGVKKALGEQGGATSPFEQFEIKEIVGLG